MSDKDDPKTETQSLKEDAFLYAKQKYEVVVYKASHLVEKLLERPKTSEFKKTAKIVATLHLYFAILMAFVQLAPDSSKYFDLAMWIVAPLAAPSSGGSSGGDQTFTPLHTYFISTTGSNANNCLSPAQACADITASGLTGVVCGDVILVNSGTYTNSALNASGGNQFPTVGTCPSTSGGIDGHGGIYFVIVLCAGPDVMSCKINNNDYGIYVQKSNWAFSGFWATTPIVNQVCFFGNNNQFVGNDTARHHLAFLNSIASTCGDAGFATSQGAGTVGSFDQTALVGVAAWNAANSQNGHFGECGSGISIVPANGTDTSAGTHVYIAGYFGAYNTNTGTPNGGVGCDVGGMFHTDGEGIVLDTWGAGATTTGYLYQAVIEQSVIWHSGGAGILILPNGATLPSDKAQYFVLGNTTYASNNDPQGTCTGEMAINLASPNSSPTTSSLWDIENNIFLAINAGGVCGIYFDGTGLQSYAGLFNAASGGNLASPTVTIQNNYLWNSHVPTSNGYNSTNDNVFFAPTGGARNATFTLGTNTYSNPGLASPGSLFSTAPDCTGYILVTTCMLQKYNVYTNVASSNAPTLGYQPPGPCTTKVLSNGTNAYPAWLKGINTLVVTSGGFSTSAVITEKAGATTKPCGA